MSASNPPAFPHEYWDTRDPKNPARYERPGMTLRDYFAAAALVLIASPKFEFVEGTASSRPGEQDVAAAAFSVADAMLAERAKP